MSAITSQELAQTDILAYLKQHEEKELLRFLTCGSVDDGKSTLIGRLLYDSKLVYEDQLAAVKNASLKHGTTDTDFDPALLTDGLRAEREQGITIDVAYRYFSTTRRKFIIADTPGHEQYTRNMATGASNCDLAIILIDARYGVQAQTKRHSYIVSVLGIKHVVVAVNKMDLVNWSEEVFLDIRNQYMGFAAKLGIPDIRFVPMSALLGDNVVHQSTNMPWYAGGPLMHLLDTVNVASDRNFEDLRFPIQYVVRPNLDFRGYSGTLASGVLEPGMPVVILPSRKAAVVEAIHDYSGEQSSAMPGMATTITLTEDVDVSRGDMIVGTENQPTITSEFQANLVWMTDDPLAAGRSYFIKHATQTVPAVVKKIKYRVDINTLDRIPADEMALNEIGRVQLSVTRPLCVDDYDRNRHTGAFILVDRVTNNTVAAGMIDLSGHRASQPAFSRYESAAVDVQTRESLVFTQDRQKRLGHKSAVVWLTGRTGAAKRSLAYALEKQLFDKGIAAAVIDGYAARSGLSLDLEGGDPSTGENVRRTAEVAALFAEHGHVAICACLSPTAESRAWARKICTRGASPLYLEVYLNAPEEITSTRISDRMDDGRLLVDPRYETPVRPDIELSTHELGVEACVDTILETLIRIIFKDAR